MLPAHQQTFTLEGTSQQANRNIISSERYTTPTPMSDRQTAYYTFGEEYFKVWGDEADKRAAGINIVDTAAVKRTVNDEGRKAQTEAEQNPYSPGYPTHGPAREEAERHQQMNEGELHTTPGLDDASTPIYAVDGGRWRIPNYHQFQMPPSATPHEYQTHMYSNIAPADNRDTRRCPECDASDLEDWGEHMKLHAQRKANPFNWLTCD
ncbi:hypothetical protein BDW22DRAFT_1361877 [Trametopsis cervina]|nr:hypothetical protein BDW22DRAFT_1361877 [Trametopsis cervina]